MLVAILLLSLLATALCIVLLIQQERFSRLAKIVLALVAMAILLLMTGLGAFIYLLHQAASEGTPDTRATTAALVELYR